MVFVHCPMCNYVICYTRGDDMPYDGYTEARAAANKRYLASQAWIKYRTTAEDKDAIQAHAQARGESVNGFVKRAIQETMERDKGAGG